MELLNALRENVNTVHAVYPIDESISSDLASVDGIRAKKTRLNTIFIETLNDILMGKKKPNSILEVYKAAVNMTQYNITKLGNIIRESEEELANAEESEQNKEIIQEPDEVIQVEEDEVETVAESTYDIIGRYKNLINTQVFGRSIFKESTLEELGDNASDKAIETANENIDEINEEEISESFYLANTSPILESSFTGCTTRNDIRQLALNNYRGIKKILEAAQEAEVVEEEIEDKTGETMTTDDEAIIERLGLPIYTSAITSANKLLSRLAIVESLIEKNKKMIKKYVR